MIINEAVLITLLFCTCFYVTITDYKLEIIPNKTLIVVGLLGLLANTFYYCFFAQAFIKAFMLNFAVLTILSIAFYSLHIWAAGDSKLLILAIFLLPARLYYQGDNIVATVIIMLLIFVIAYAYIIGESIYLGVKNKNFFHINFHAVDESIKQIIMQYIKCICILTLVNQIFSRVLPVFYESNLQLVMIVNMILILASYNMKFLDRKMPFLILVAVSFLSVFSAEWQEIHINWLIYPVIFFVILLRMFAEKYNYQNIPTSNVKKGMVLAYSTIVAFMLSRIKGLPRQTTEDIRSRISAEEAENIKRWENSKYGRSEITIVRKIPFAVFISLGVISYMLMELLIR